MSNNKFENDVELNALDCQVMDELVTHRATGDITFLLSAKEAIEEIIETEHPEAAANPIQENRGFQEFCNDLLKAMAKRLGIENLDLDQVEWAHSESSHVDQVIKEIEGKTERLQAQCKRFTTGQPGPGIQLNDDLPPVRRTVTPDNILVIQLANGLGVKPYQVAAALNNISQGTRIIYDEPDKF